MVSGRERGARRAQYLPIAEHGLIGDLHTVALVGTVLDFSPYLRPREWAVAIVVADVVLWNGADLLLAESFAATAGGRDLLGRALLFRMVAEQLAAEPRHGAHLGPYRRVLSALRDPETRRVRDHGSASGGAAIGHPFV